MARIALCQEVLIEYMGYMCLSAVLKAQGHTVEVFLDDRLDEQRFVDELKRFQPDVVGFSLLTPSVPWALRIAGLVKEQTTALVVVGNVHVMMEPSIIEDPSIDLACLGEGEFALTELCRALDQGTDYRHIPGFWAKTPGGEVIKNPPRTDLVVMDEMPYLDRQLYNKYRFFRQSPYLRVMAGRGCPFRCSFCTNPAMTDHFGGGKSYFRKRSPQSAIAEIEHLIREHPRPVKHVFFIDEVFWIKNEWLREFMTLYNERIRLPFTANFRFGAITEDDIRLLSVCGAELAVATETADEEQRRKLLNKPVSNEHIIQVTDWMHKHGVQFASSVFFGLPGDTFADHLERLEFFRRIRPTYLWTTFFQPYPGLKLTESLEIQAHLPAGKAFRRTLHHDMYLDLPDRERLINLKKVYFLMMKFPWLERPLAWLANYRLPWLFNALFFLHFAWYALWWEHFSLKQLLHHVRTIVFNPLFRKHHPLGHTGRPYTPPSVPRQPSPAATVGENGHGDDCCDHDHSSELAATGFVEIERLRN